MELRVDDSIIDFVKRIYNDDSTKMMLNEGRMLNMEVTSGIRQGCTLSSVLFKLVTYKIIEQLRKTEGIRIGGRKVTCLFYADDGLLMNKIKRMSNMTNSVIEKSCDRILIGKTYWKGVVLPGVLYGAEVVNLKETDIDCLQKAENSALRRIVKAQKWTPLAGIRGEVGISNMKTRIVRGRLQYLRRILQGENRILQAVVRDGRMGRMSNWWRTTEKYLVWAELLMVEFENIAKGEIKQRLADKVERESGETRCTKRIHSLYTGV